MCRFGLLAPLAVWLAVLLSAALATRGYAQETSHYPNGTSGIKGGTVPPPGHYWLMYNRFYEADETITAGGQRGTGPNGEALGLDIIGYANVHRFLHVTDYQICGANYSWNAVLPLVAIDARIGAFGVDDREFRIGDLNVEPFVIEWHQPRYDFGYLYGLFAPSAHRDDSRPALPGKAHWTHYLGVAGTYYFDDERLWSLSALSRYEVATKRNDIDIRPGDNFSFEWGFARNVEKVMDIGVSGFCSWQVTLDKGDDIHYANVRDRAFGIGPEVQYYSTKYNFGYHFRYWWEFEARDRTQGTIATLTIVKPF